jgi:hypothetical protein
VLCGYLTFLITGLSGSLNRFELKNRRFWYLRVWNKHPPVLLLKVWNQRTSGSGYLGKLELEGYGYTRLVVRKAIVLEI